MRFFYLPILLLLSACTTTTPVVCNCQCPQINWPEPVIIEDPAPTPAITCPAGNELLGVIDTTKASRALPASTTADDYVWVGAEYWPDTQKTKTQKANKKTKASQAAQPQLTCFYRRVHDNKQLPLSLKLYPEIAAKAPPLGNAWQALKNGRLMCTAAIPTDCGITDLEAVAKLAAPKN